METRDAILFILAFFLLGGTIAGMFVYNQSLQDERGAITVILRAPEDGGFDPLDVYLKADEENLLFIKNEGLETHGFAIPELGIDEQIKPGKSKYVKVTPPLGSYHGHCSVYCSDYHPVMQFTAHATRGGFASREVAHAFSAQDLMEAFPVDIVRDPTDLPPPLNRNHSEVVKVELTTMEVLDDVGSGAPYFYWTFNGKIPGPFLRVREGDTVELTLSNSITSKYNHSIDLHAVTGQGGGASYTQVAPGESKRFTFKAINAGLYVYHCATSDIPTHMTHGMYGLILVEPEEGLSIVDREYYFMQGEIYSQEGLGHEGFQHFSTEKMLKEEADYVVFNGKPAAITGSRSPIFKTGENVRLYVGNGGVSYVSSFHVIGEIFDKVYPEASLSSVHKNVQTTMIPAGGATAVEFATQVPAKYILVDHALSRLGRGAVAILEAQGPPVEEGVYSKVELSEEEQAALRKAHSHSGVSGKIAPTAEEMAQAMKH